MNDLAYVNSEIVLLLSVIFKTDPKLGEEIAFALLYTGPMNMILGSGKNMLASRYNEVLCQSPCFFMQAERFGSEEKQDKNATLFLGRLDNNNRPIKPESAQRRQCVEFIQNEVGSQRGLEVTLAAIHQRNARKDKVAREQSKRKQEDFVRSPYCQFLETFEHQCAQSSAQIEQCLKSNDLAWDPNNPVKCIISHLSPLFRADENDSSPRMRRKTSLTKSGDNIPVEEDNQLITKLIELQNKIRAAITEGVDVEKKQRHYLFRVLCQLVIFAVNLEKKMGDKSIRFKRTKSLVVEAGVQSERKALSRSFDCATPVYRPDPEERLMLGVLYYIQQIMTQFGITLSELKNPNFYPAEKAPAEYVSTQEALSSSGTGFGSLGY